MKFLFNKILSASVLALCACLLLSSCAVVKATNQPDRKDLSVLRPGTDRARVIAELGKPVHSETKNGHKSDIFNFVQGYSKTNKTLRALGHGVADVYTLGLWEVVGTPIEGVASGNRVEVVVNYDNHDQVSKIKVLKGGKVVGAA
jgi:outer membrane protein assembly factor BamE (lipoprotein component of BamABCDE complex)